MGSALAGSFLDQGHSVTVWNRTPAKCDTLQGRGAQVAATPSTAIEASRASVLCVLDYAALREVLGMEACRASLPGSDLVNLTWGTAVEAEEMAEWASARGAAYLDGGIPVYPKLIGDTSTSIIYSGRRAVWTRHQDLLLALGQRSKHIGPEVGDANVLLLAMSAFFHVALGAFLETAAYTEVANGQLQRYLELALPAVDLLARTIEEYGTDIERRDFQTDQASLTVVLEAMYASLRGMRTSGQAGSLSETLIAMLEPAQQQGMGELSFAALFKDIARGSAARETSNPSQE